MAVVAGVATLAACGDGGTDAGTTAAATSPRAAFEHFLDATAAGDVQATWRLLSEQAQQAFGPTRSDFRQGVWHSLEEGAGTWGVADYRVVLDKRLGERALVAIAGVRAAEGRRRFDAYAVPLVRDGDRWRIDIGGGPAILELRPAPPDDVVVPRPAIEGLYEASGGLDALRVWVDGRRIPVTVDRDAGEGRVGFRTTPTRALEPGRHTAVAYARAGGSATATATAFRVRAAAA